MANVHSPPVVVVTSAIFANDLPQACAKIDTRSPDWPLEIRPVRVVAPP